LRAIKKINNNVAICLDGKGKELVAFGNGIGFPQMPYEINDLSKIHRTFYNISNQYLVMLNDIPPEIIEFTAKVVEIATNRLPYTLNQNLVLTLADHITFAIERVRKNIYIRMPLAYDLELNYPEEIKIGKYVLIKVKEEFKVKLPENEASGIAMSFVNARLNRKNSDEDDSSQKQYDEILEDIIKIIEREMKIQIKRNSFDYARYATHVQYLLKRIYENKYIDTDNLVMYKSLKEEFSDVADCVDKINEYFKKEINCTITEEERLYLILHINRICTKEGL